MRSRNDPVEKNRLLDEIQQVQRAQKAGVKPNLAALRWAGKPHEQAHGGRRLPLALPRLPEVVLPPRPKALRGVMWCAYSDYYSVRNPTYLCIYP